MNDFLKNIQKANNETKKKWLIVLTGISMLIIILFWLGYMNSVVFVKSGEQVSQETTSDFWPTLKTGIQVTINNVANGIKEKFNK